MTPFRGKEFRSLAVASSTLRRPRVAALLGVTEQRLLDRVGQPEAAVVRESVEPLPSIPPSPFSAMTVSRAGPSRLGRPGFLRS